MSHVTDLSLPGRKIRWIPLLIAMLIFAMLSAWMAHASKGFMEADGITHFNARRFAWDQPMHRVGVWSRPFCVMLYMIPTHLGGLMGTRLTSLALALIGMLLTVRVASRQRDSRPEVAGIFLLCAPLWFVHSFSELTEIPFAVLLIGAFAAYQARWFVVMAIVLALSPLARPEGFGFIALAAIAMVLHRRWIALLILPMGVIFWSWWGWYTVGSPADLAWYQWLPHNWPYSTDSVYGSGSMMRFIIILPAVVGPLVFPLIWLGVGKTCFRVSDVNVDLHRRVCDILIMGIPILILMAHSLLWFLGKMASNGEPRYMLIVAPFWAILAGRGYDKLVEWWRLPRPIAWSALAAMPAIIANAFYPCFPLGLTSDDELAENVAAWVAQHPQVAAKYPRIGWSLPRLSILLAVDPLDGNRSVTIRKSLATNRPPGVMVIWDTIYTTHNSDEALVVPEESFKEAGWLHAASIQGGSGQWVRTAEIYLSPLDNTGRPATAPSQLTTAP